MILVVVLLLTSSARAANSVTLYSPDPADPWNRLRAALFLRTAPTGDTFGLDALDPLLWSGTRDHLLEDPSRAAALAALDAARTAPLVRHPVKRALLQRDLWSVFDWTAARDRDPDVVRPLQRRLAVLLRRVALTADEIRALPDPYAAAVVAHRFPPADDPAHPDASFLPPDLFDPAGPWVRLRHSGDGDDGTVAPIHAFDFGDRSVFEAYFRHPAGRQPGLDYLARLAARTRTLPGNVPPVGDENLPPLPAGATFALVRRAVLFDGAGRLRPTRLVESVQLRVYRHGDPWTDARPAQSVHEFVLSRAEFLADPARALRAIAPGERAVQSPQFRSHGIDPFEFRPSTRPSDYTVPVLASCRACHAFPGVRSVNSFTRLFGPAAPHPALAEGPPDLQASLAIRRKESRPEWRLLREFPTPP